MSDDELRHYGVPGMKWGKRGRNANYSDQQAKRDKQIYGARGTRKINKALNNGDNVSVARGAEKTRRDRVMGKNKYVRQGGKVAGALVGVAATNIGITALKRVSTNYWAQRWVRDHLGGMSTVKGVQAAAEVLDTPIARVAISTGAAKVATMFAGDAAVAANMRINGYDPSRK